MSSDEPFTKMAERVAHNTDSTFGGACVIVFPTTANFQLEPIELLILDSKGEPAQFLATLRTRLDMLKDEIAAKDRQGFGGR